MIGWVGAAWLLLAGSTALLFLGLPVAFSFLAINLLGAWLWLGGEPGLAQLARNSVSSVMSFSLTARSATGPPAEGARKRESPFKARGSTFISNP